ncbi:MAG: EAL domain-containing protein [Acidobacteria bacterium]|nr:EAL domain-containing protein [Acidobacteriota bacterium]
MKEVTGKQKYVLPFAALVTACGAVACIFSAYNFPLAKFDLGLLLLALLTVLLGSRLTMQLPSAKVHVSVSDTLIFIILLLYGGEAAVLIAAAEALYTSFRFRSRGITIRFDGVLFNAALMACSTFLSAWALRSSLGSAIIPLQADNVALLTAVCVMALVQYAASTSLAAIYTACEANQGVWTTWNKKYFPTSLTYFAGAATATGLVTLKGLIGFYAVIATATAVTISYLTLRRYINDLKASVSQAEQAEHARAEVERARAEQAERHVDELNHYVAELKRTTDELQTSKEHFRHAAFHDALTNLPNRALFTDHLKLAIERTKRQPGHNFAVLFMDLDRFKNINDSLGHIYGDQLLVAISQRLKGCLRQVDVIARLGGDEFAVLLDGFTEPNDVLRVAEKIQKAISEPLTIDRNEAFTSASIGIALSSTGYERPEDVLRDADTAMYRAKDGGKARHEIFDEVMYARAVSLLNLENDLRRAIERQEFEVYYQPIVTLKTGGVCGFEALLRWQHPTRGMISPAEFIPLAEETGLIIPLGQWVLEESCRQMREWHEQSLANRMLTVSVNLSGKQLSRDDLCQQIKLILERTGLDPRSLKLEITESVVMDNADLAINMLQQLHNLGIQLSIDDFGTGYSSLSYLHRFPVNNLKIDRSFISRMGLGDENLEIVRTIIMLARNLGMEVIAEGIETKEQLAQLRALSCSFGQGYLFSVPLDAESAVALIRQVQQNAAALPSPADAPRDGDSKYLYSSLVM